MKLNPLLSTTALLATMTASAVAPTPVMASNVDYQPTTLTLNGETVVTAQHIVAPDPWNGGQVTSWLPVYYLGDVMQKLFNNGATRYGMSWNGAGSTGTLTIGVPDGTLGANSGQAQSAPNSMNIEVSTQTHTAIFPAPRLTAIDPASGKPTTYVPEYYVMEALAKAGIQSTWNGTVWAMTTGTTSAPPASGTTETKLEAAVSLWNFLAANAKLQRPNGSTATFAMGSYTDVPSQDEAIIGSLTTMPYGTPYLYDGNLPAFQPDSSNTFGSSDPITEAELDQALLNLSGLTSNNAPIPYGSAVNLCDATGVEVSGLDPNAPMTTTEFQTWLQSLIPMMRGWKQVGTDAFQLIQPWLFAASAMGSNAQAVENSWNAMDSIVIHVDPSTDTMTMQAPDYPLGNPMVLKFQSASYSLNGGQTWITPTDSLGYSSGYAPDGGSYSTPSTILIRAKASYGMYMVYLEAQNPLSTSSITLGGTMPLAFGYRNGQFFDYAQG
ncbi:hypothetical protein ACOJUR_00025 [Alicyclobacillus tolerans]|uniref:hypothetical protein n=1 Tax=Alicyclobacillus tolerans TaxID=90970 RepID=UPI003B7EE870